MINRLNQAARNKKPRTRYEVTTASTRERIGGTSIEERLERQLNDGWEIVGLKSPSQYHEGYVLLQREVD